MVDRYCTVLLVDNEEMILDFGGRIIQRLGHRVLTAPSCELAYRIAEENGEAIDLVILDYCNAASNGEKVLKRFKEVNDDLKIMITSGYCEFAPVSSLLKEQGFDFIQKPFTAAELTDKVNWMLS
ncbi:MAG TPA: response regulator [Desulfobacterales bacterium]|nr:response regulator [Desulfobacterales bacterium]